MMKKGATFFPAEGGGGGGKSSGLKCNIVLLDGREVQLEINKKTPGQWIFDHVSGKLGVTEREYFGLLYEDEQKCQQWLEMAKPIKKQIKKNHSKVFYCIRLYPSNPLLIGESTRIQLYWQLKRDFTSGRLPCLADTTLQLVALMAQVEIGDWSGQPTDYNVQLKLHMEEVELHQGDISGRHQHLRGTSETDARGQLLKLINLLEFYGMVFFDVRYEDKVRYMLGMSPFGLALCKKMKIAQSYNWSRVVQVLYRGRKFIVRVSGDWVKNNKFQQLNFDVDSSKTCKDLYNTFVEHINFYTKQSSSKKQEEGGDNETFTQMPVSSSIENLSRQLLKEKDNKGREYRLHRSLSLPRRTKNNVDMQSLFQAPPITNTSLNDPVLQALQSRRPNRTHSLSPTRPSDTKNPPGTYVEIDDLTMGMGPRTNSLDPESQNLATKQFDTQSLISHDIPIHDSLMDLAEGLGSGSNVDGEEEESFVIEDLDSSPGRKHRSNSLPHIAVLDSVSTASQNNSPANTSKQGKRGHSISDEKLQSRKLLFSWVKEQKKKDQVKVSTEDQRNSIDSFPQTTPPTLPALPKSFSESSPSQIYKLKTPIERPASSLLPHLSSAKSHPYDIYDVPRPSPVPSPYPYKRPYQSNSASAYSSRHSVSNIGEENDYDIPRSLTDLRRVDSPYLMRTGTRSNERMAYSRASSCSEHTSQVAMLKDEYPDYDIPRPSDSIDDPDYDVPRSVKSMGTVDSKSEGNLSFGALDKIMADINMQVAGTVVQDEEGEEEGKSIVTNVDSGSLHQLNKQLDVVENSIDDQIEQAEGNTCSDENKLIIRSSTANEEDVHVSSQTQLDKDFVTVAKERTISPPNTINESTLAKRVLRPLAHQPLSLPQIPLQIPNQPLQESAYDRLAARQALEQLKKDGIVPMDAHEKKKQPVEEGGAQKENKRSKTFSSGGSEAILPKLEDLLHGNSNPKVQRMPFDPTFFARQTAFQQKQLLQQVKTLPEHENQPKQNGAETKDHKSNSASKLPEPIYQEITELNNHRSQRSWSGSRSNLVSNTIAPVGESGHKRAHSGGDMLSVKRSGSVAVRNEMGGDRWGSESVRGSVRHPPPHRIDIVHLQETNDDESIPNSPSFYTKNPEASTMPDSSSKQQHFFKDLTSLDNTNPPTGGHNRVMNWMQQGTPWDGGAGQMRGGVAPVQLERSVSMSQSVHSQLSNRTGLPNQPGQFKDHLYEDPDRLKSKLQSSMRVPGTSAGVRSLPRVSSLPRSALPYVTRELPSSKPGSTMYATDV